MTTRHTEGYYKAAYSWFVALDDGRKPASYWSKAFDVNAEVIRRWRREGKKTKYYRDPEVFAQAGQLLAAGGNYLSVARAVGVAESSLRYRFPEYGRKHKSKDFALQLLQDGASYSEVERTTGIKYKELRKRYPGYEWTLDQNIDLNRAITNAKKKMPNHIREIFFGP